MKWVVLFFCLIVTGTSFAQCVPEGSWMANNSPRPVCCEGLELNPRPVGSPGYPGQCLRKVDGKLCMGAGSSFSGFHGKEADCCSGLSKEQIMFEFPMFRCVQKTCAGENQWVGVGPQAAECCEGLVRQIPTDGRIGAAQCVKKSSCVKENDFIVLGPGRPGCCEGLEAFNNDPRRMGGAQCVKKGAQNCLVEGAPLFQYPGAPACCQGLQPGRASQQSPIGFADVCVRVSRPQINTSEVVKELPSEPSWLVDDPGSTVSNQ